MSRTTDELLRRVLGPDEPELTCEACFEQIDRFVERELRDGPVQAEAAVPGMTAHLAGCPACAEEHVVLRSLVGSPRG
jgi:hypothetical protein